MVSKIKTINAAAAIACLGFNVNAEVLDIEKYQQAERQLAQHTEALVYGTVEKPNWTKDDKLVYQSHTKNGKQFFIVDTKTKAKKLAFNHQKLAKALARVTEQEVSQTDLPFSRIDFISDGLISLKSR